MSPKSKPAKKKASPKRKPTYSAFGKKMIPKLAKKGLTPVEVVEECGRLWREKYGSSGGNGTQVGGGEFADNLRKEILAKFGFADDKPENMDYVARNAAALLSFYESQSRDSLTDISKLLTEAEPDDTYYEYVAKGMLDTAGALAELYRSLHERVSASAPGRGRGGVAAAAAPPEGADGAASGGGGAPPPLTGRRDVYFKGSGPGIYLSVQMSADKKYIDMSDIKDRINEVAGIAPGSPEELVVTVYGDNFAQHDLKGFLRAGMSADNLHTILVAKRSPE